MESIVYFIMYLWYKLPSIKFVNPIKISKKDNRSFQWFTERYENGFDECELWDLSAVLHHKISKEIDLKEPFIITKDKFSKWITNPKSIPTITWLLMRINKYIEWNCPTFYTNETNYVLLSEDIQKEYQVKIQTILNKIIKQNIISEEEVVFMYNHIFGFGW